MPLCQPHTVTELSGEKLSTVPQTDEPGPVLLKDVLTRVTERSTEGIETGLGGVALVSSIIEFQRIFVDLSNQVAVKVDLADTVFKGDAGVSRGPVGVVLDCLNHLGFDLTHERQVERV